MARHPGTVGQLSLPNEQERRIFLHCWAVVLGEMRMEEQFSNNEPVADSDQPALTLWRHRQHSCMTRCLVASAEALRLDKQYAQAYFPLLDGILQPTPSATTPHMDTKRLLSAQLARVQSLVGPLLRDINPPIHSFHCLSWIIIHHLLRHTSGYDARLRHAWKIMAVVMFLTYDTQSDHHPHDDITVALQQATERFDSLEQLIANQLLLLGQQQRRDESSNNKANSVSQETKSTMKRSARMMRTLKIGGTAIAAGGLFAVTGGLAAPAIAAGFAAIAGGTIIGGAAALLSSTLVVTTLFGIGGGGLAAHKMRRRTEGLTEFLIQQETAPHKAHLFTTVAISGWLRDECDYQRPWGVLPTNPPISDPKEVLERFYAYRCPDQLPYVEQHLDMYNNRVMDLYRLLCETYGCDPRGLIPRNLNSRSELSDEQAKLVQSIFSHLGLSSSVDSTATMPAKVSPPPSPAMKNKAQSPKHPLADCINSDIPANYTEARHLTALWDYSTTYGGELYTVKFESDLSKKLCDSVENFLRNILYRESTKQILQYTAMAALSAALTIPSALVGLTAMIDEDWTLICERSDEAGIELARSLLNRKNGHRPISLVGFSFGARIIFSCLKEIARCQPLWEDYQKTKSPPSKQPPNLATTDGTLEMSFENMREPASIIEDVILMGIPNYATTSNWNSVRQIVAGRFVNCFSRKDLVLSLMFRYKNFGLSSIAGTCPVPIRGVENVDVTDIIPSHREYCLRTRDILERVRFGQPFCSVSASYESVMEDAEKAIEGLSESEAADIH